ncbi:MAG: hypothetical protein U0797_19950 [Gemmataceae bacterium]
MKPTFLSSLVALSLAALANAAAPPAKPAPKPMAFSRLAPAKPYPQQCVLRYRVTTNSPECQLYFDQALGYFYSYVWMEAARSFETALQHDPTCPMAWWGLARALERYGRGDATKALLEAWKLKDHCSGREQMLIKASMQEKGQLPGVGDAEARKQKAIATLDELLALHGDDEEAWYFRAQLAGGSGLFGGKASSVPFYKALLRVNPLHPGASHELVHFYENFQRPALGWPYAEKYIESSPGLPHAFHMQAHLATRLGRWNKTSDRSARAIELEREYHRRESVKPRDDHQYSHHLETLLVSLTHDGRFAEAEAIKRECEANNFQLRNPFFRLLLAERDYDGALKIAGEVGRGGAGGPYGRRGRPPQFGRKGDKTQASYYAALVYLKMGDPARALPEVEVLRHALRDQKSDKGLELNLWETQGLYLCATGDPAAGLKLLQKLVDRNKNNYGHHAWGNGAVHMEAWGVGALTGNKLDVAEEAFHEALAHDPGSVRAALGMQVVCERLGRAEEVERYAALARRCWAKADPGYLPVELAALRGEKVTRPDPTRAARR